MEGLGESSSVENDNLHLWNTRKAKTHDGMDCLWVDYGGVFTGQAAEGQHLSQ